MSNNDKKLEESVTLGDMNKSVSFQFFDSQNMFANILNTANLKIFPNTMGYTDLTQSLTKILEILKH